MKLITVYKTAITLSGFFFLLYWFAPWGYSVFSLESQNLLSYSGYNAVIAIPEAITWILFIGHITSYIGMLLLRKHFRLLFLLMTIISILQGPLNGISIISPIEVLLIDISTILRGFALALAYYSRVTDYFH